MKIFTRKPKYKLTISILICIILGALIGGFFGQKKLGALIGALMGLLLGVFIEGKRFGWKLFFSFSYFLFMKSINFHL